VRCLVVLALLLAPLTAHADDCVPASIWRDGQRDGTVCLADATARGLTVIDLSEDWTPPVLGAAPDGTAPGYRSSYLALAQERFGDAGVDSRLAGSDRYFELFGITPTFDVVQTRLADDARHACHDAIDDTPLARAPQIVEESKLVGKERIARARALRADLDHERTRRGLADLDALAATSAYFRRAAARLATLEAHVAAIRSVQAHLACDGLLDDRPIAGAYTWQTSNMVNRFQRGSMILPSGRLDAQTREAFALGSRERDFRTALRALRERVIAATGLIEDGTAGGGPGTVLGRALEPEATWRVRGHAPLPDAAPDLISPATEVAARALGWLDARSTRIFLDELRETSPSRAVAVALPAAPAWHATRMQLDVEIDRGDVWHVRGHSVARRPALLLYATDGDRRIPLVRWPTTIGGWQKEKVEGDIEERWKESPVGRRIWRDLYVGPRWLPPRTTPDKELVRSTDDGYVLARELFGPSYRAAFGMVAFFHLVEDRHPDRVETWDQGIRTHGTGNLVSLGTGVSHGCHRLLGFHVIRLADFVLAHREHVRHGVTPTYYRRIVRHRGVFPVAIDSAGYRIELVPPLPVNVLPGRIHR